MSSLSFVQISAEGVYLTTEDAIGFIRHHKRIGEKVQRSALTTDGVRGIVADRVALLRMIRPDTIVKVRHLFLLADPKSRNKTGGWRGDLLATMGKIEKLGGAIKDVDMQLTTADPKDRYHMLAVAIAQLASNGRTVHLRGKRSGRKRLVFSAQSENAIEKIWLNVRDYQTDQDAMKAIKALEPEYSSARVRKAYGPRYKRDV